VIALEEIDAKPKTKTMIVLNNNDHISNFLKIVAILVS
jgi:hypothetical protein